MMSDEALKGVGMELLTPMDLRYSDSLARGGCSDE